MRAMMLSSTVKQLVLEHGFDLVGVASARDPLLSEALSRYVSWIEAGRSAAMDYLARHAELKAHPERLLPGCRSVLCVGMLYAGPHGPEESSTAQVSQYARGADYHDLMTKKLEALAATLRERHGIAARAFVDSQPIFERFWAWRAGLGWIGKNAMLINRRQGSYFFLGGLLVDAELEPDAPAPDHCGRCRRCIEACPTGAIIEGEKALDSARCIAYHTIENKGAVPENVMANSGRWIAGCDICQAVCPWNDPIMQGSAFVETNAVYGAPLAELAGWTADDFKRATAGASMGRMKYSGFVRNVAIAVSNSGLSNESKSEALRSLESKLSTLPEGQGREGARAAVIWAKKSRRMSALKTIVVTGGTGFLGFHLVPQLVESGYHVRLLNRRRIGHRPGYASWPGVEAIEVDFRDGEALDRACAGAWAIVHGAGLVSYDLKDQALMHESHVTLTERMIACARRSKVRRFVHVSSIVTLGHGREPRDEISSYNAEPLRLAYWNTKTDAERIALAANGPGLEVVSVNPGTLLGRGERGDQLGSFLRRLAASERPFLPDGGSDFLDAADAARGTIQALERGRAGERYVLGSENLTYAQLHARLRALDGQRSRPRVLPRPLLAFVAVLLELLERLTGLNSRVNAARLRRVNGVYMFHDLAKAKRELGYQPRFVDEALRHMLDEDREQFESV